MTISQRCTVIALTLATEVAWRASRIAPEQFEDFRKFLNQTSRVARLRLQLAP